MISRFLHRKLCASKAAAVTLAVSVAFVATARAETWELEVATARMIIGQKAGEGVVSILLSEAGVDLFDRLAKEAKGPTKQVRIDGIAISLARYDAKRRELRVRIRGMSDDEAHILADRIATKAAKIEVVEEK